MLLILLLVLLLGMPVLQASDLVREQRIAAELEQRPMIGRSLRLEGGGGGFFAIHSERQRGRPRGGVILLHGRDMHPDWPGVIHTLRTGLPEHGWETLALQLPLASPGAGGREDSLLLAQAAPRIAAAVAFLRSRGLESVVLVGHDLGALMAVAFLRTAGQSDVDALVLVGLPAASGAVEDEPALSGLGEIRIPLLDLYGSRDAAATTGAPQARADAAVRAGNQSYRQDRIMGADYLFTGMEQSLLARVRSWLTRYAGSPPQ